MISKLLRRVWLGSALCVAGSFLAGYIGFHPAWSKAPPLSDGSAGSFARTAARIDADDLLRDASPQERVRWLLEICRQPNGLARDHALYKAIQRMQPSDFFAGLADLPAFGRQMVAMSHDARQVLIEAAMERWFDVDENGAMRSLAAAQAIVESNALDLPAMGESDLSVLHRTLATRAPEWMRGQIDKLSEATGREIALRTLMSAEAQRDPRKAREWLESFRGGKEWADAFAAYVTGLSVSDPRAAMELALTGDGEGKSERDSGLVAQTFNSIAAHSPSVTGEFLHRIEPRLRPGLMKMAVYSIGENGGDSFAWFADRVAADPTLLDPPPNSHPTNNSVMGPLVSRDPLRALELITTLPNAQQQALRDGALTRWSSDTPDTFLDWLATQPPEILPKEFKGLDRLANQEPERFARWVETLPRGELRERSQVALATELAKQGRIAEATRHFPQSSSAPLLAHAAGDLAGVIAASDPGVAARWVGTLPAGPAQASAAQGLVVTWARQSPQATARWIESLPAGATRDAATGSFANVLVSVEPGAATEWIARIADPRARQNAARRLFDSWSITDPAGARAWLRAYPDVSEAVKGRLLRSR